MFELRASPIDVRHVRDVLRSAHIIKILWFWNKAHSYDENDILKQKTQYSRRFRARIWNR